MIFIALRPQHEKELGEDERLFVEIISFDDQTLLYNFWNLEFNYYNIMIMNNVLFLESGLLN